MKKAPVSSILVAAVLLAVAVVAEAQQPIRIARIGYLGSTRSDPPEQFRQMLQRLGYIEGKNVQFEYRFIDGQQDKASALVADLVQLNVDVLVVTTLSSIRAAKQATKTIPIVMFMTNDPVSGRNSR